MSSATTRSRPIINTRDEPHADAEHFRRLHVIVGDSNMSEYSTFLKVGATACMLRMMEDPAVSLRDLTLENPIRAIREISHDVTCRKLVKLQNGKEMSALDIQNEYLHKALDYSDKIGFPPLEERALRMWQHCMSKLAVDPLSLDREVDWVIKHNLVEAYRERHGLLLSDSRIQLVDLSYHDINQERGLFYKMQNRGLVDRLATETEVTLAREIAPQTTRARLRGEFIKQAKLKNRDYTVDWVHLKVNDQTQKTVLCKDPLKSHDERVENLIASL